MMYLFFVLFFTSLISIIIMIGRKLVLLQNGQVSSNEEVTFEVPHLEKVKHFTIENIKKYEHIILVKTVRLYVKGINFFKNKYQAVKIKIKDRRMKNNLNGENKETSKFLKIIGDYKNKIREITHKIKKEEDL